MGTEGMETIRQPEIPLNRCKLRLLADIEMRCREENIENGNNRIRYNCYFVDVQEYIMAIQLRI